MTTITTFAKCRLLGQAFALLLHRIGPRLLEAVKQVPGLSADDQSTVILNLQDIRQDANELQSQLVTTNKPIKMALVQVRGYVFELVTELDGLKLPNIPPVAVLDGTPPHGASQPAPVNIRSAAKRVLADLDGMLALLGNKPGKVDTSAAKAGMRRLQADAAVA